MNEIPTIDAFNLYVRRQSVTCTRKDCTKAISHETIAIYAFVHEFNNGSYGAVSGFSSRLVFDETVNNWKTFIVYIVEQVKTTVMTGEEDKKAKRNANAMKNEFQKMMTQARTKFLPPYSLDLLKGLNDGLNIIFLRMMKYNEGMYIQLEFVKKVCSNFKYWTDTRVLEVSIERYKKFVDLIAFKRTKMLVPTMDIDLAWHAHQCLPRDYFAYTSGIMSRLLDHDDTIGSGDLNKGYASTFIGWSQLYNEPYSSTLPEFSHWQSGRNVSSVLLPPVGIARVLKWRQHVTKYSSAVMPYAVLLPVAEPVSGEASRQASVSVIGTPVHDPQARPHVNGGYFTVGGGCASSGGGGCAMYVGGAGCISSGGCAAGASGCASGCGGGCCGGCGGGCGG